jgi:hypothetical protein
MPLDSFYPVLLAENPAASARFYTEHMGFKKVFESDWYVSLKHQESPAYELAIISDDPGGLPTGDLRAASQLRGAQRAERVRAASGSGSEDTPTA